MKDVTREKYARLMSEIENLEDFISDLEEQADADPSELKKLKDELAEKRAELTRISDGCGRPHPQS